jgi:hypothetical protein
VASSRHLRLSITTTYTRSDAICRTMLPALNLHVIRSNCYLESGLPITLRGAGSSPATRYRTQHNRTQEGLPRGTACTSDTTSGLYAQRALDTGSLARRPADENKPGAKTAGLALVLAYDTDDAFNRLNRILGVVVVL